MNKFFGFILFCAGVVLMPIPATMLFQVSYGTALGAAVLGVVAALLTSLGAALMKA